VQNKWPSDVLHHPAGIESIVTCSASCPAGV